MLLYLPKGKVPGEIGSHYLPIQAIRTADIK